MIRAHYDTHSTKVNNLFTINFSTIFLRLAFVNARLFSLQHKMNAICLQIDDSLLPLSL